MGFVSICFRFSISSDGEKQRVIRSWSPPGVKTKKPDHFWPGSGYDGVSDIPLPGIPYPHLGERGWTQGRLFSCTYYTPRVHFSTFLPPILGRSKMGWGFSVMKLFLWGVCFFDTCFYFNYFFFRFTEIPPINQVLIWIHLLVICLC